MDKLIKQLQSYKLGDHALSDSIKRNIDKAIACLEAIKRIEKRANKDG